MTTTHQLTPGSPGGRTVILVHGMEDNWRSWLPLARHLDPAWRVHALELPWNAGSDHEWRRHGSPGAVLGELLGTAEARRAFPHVDLLVGHSLGSSAVLELLTEVTTPAMLIAPFYCPPEMAVTWPVFDRARADFLRIIDQSLELRLSRRLSRVEPDVGEAMLAKVRDRIGPIGFMAMFEAFLHTARLDLGAVTGPALVLAGDRDHAMGPARAAALRRELPHAEFVVEPGFGHFLHVRHAEVAAAHLRAFLKEVTS
ncbi:alpha/beta hydrolase [Planotetraspora sp. A-T 1434]|uniref:alpha/beta fold hydrolase n=1 Tax=Planotetraspora sp. A-T 1434 TaxID=2979219 RepID=UPI0021BF0491|nr:alpha/beta hydrolase [Planotetraspora sp. A-T 1434]MCT9933140.1 alpha/beta hydrolase [Planotetraspora sp. A-T 1434]